MAHSHPLLPLSVVLTGRRCLVVGGGAAALSRTRALLDAGAIVTVVAPELTAGFTETTARLEPRDYARGDVAGHVLVIAAGSDAVNAAVFADAEEAGVLVNAVDDLSHSSVHFPAVARLGPVTVAVSSGATSPALARFARDEIAAVLGEELTFLATVLGPLRAELRSAGHSSEGRDWTGLIAAVRAERASGGDLAARAIAASWLEDELGRQ